MPQAINFRRFAGLAATSVFFLPCVVSSPASAQSPATAPPAAAAPASDPYWAVVKGDNVMLRSSPSVQNAYPFGRLFAGQPVKVVEAAYGWARVQAVGPTFANIYGFVKAGGTTRFDPATKTLAISGKTSLIAPNMDAKFAPDKSWRELVSLGAGDTLQVIEEVKGQSDTYYSVRLPEKAWGWVNQQFIEAVAQPQAEAFEAALKGGTTFPSAAPSATVATVPAAVPETAPPPSAPTSTGPTPTATPAVPVVAAPTTTPAATAPTTPAAAPVAAPAATPPTAVITNNPPEDNAKPTAESDAEDVARAAAREAAARAELERQVRTTTFADLESIWARVKNEAVETAELDALRGRYLALADDGMTSNTTRQYAKARAEQIGVRMQVQQSLLELAAMRADRTQRAQSVADLALAMETRRLYDAVGRLNASTVYNGDRLPLLYKLADPTTGFTIAYVLPGPSTKPSEALGLIVGIKGKKQYDETLRVNVYALDSLQVLNSSMTTTVPQP